MEFVMLGLIALLIFFMFRNGRKRQKAMMELQAAVVPGAEVILQPGIYATVDEIDEEENRLTVTSGSSTFVVHRNMVAQVVTAVEHEGAESPMIAPDDDPEFGERLSERTSESPAVIDDADAPTTETDDAASTDEPGRTDDSAGDDTQNGGRTA